MQIFQDLNEGQLKQQMLISYMHFNLFKKAVQVFCPASNLPILIIQILFPTLER